MANERGSERRVGRVVPRGKLFVTATFNNTVATVTDEGGNSLCWGSTGKAGFSGSRKSTPYAATVSLDRLIREAKEFGVRELEVYIKGPGPGRDAVLRVLRESGIRLTMIADVTPIPHNGSRPRKKKHNR
ncbi:30S ribosomal protein S11 [Microgenomates group bacterium RIFCSPLOWO2_01_FULL_46_13]|nr:MAG: 30S ribosomal protein S11 [Microgenomates group bacterium RIFCSPHIGHO2_01_FULL_45_11]OGV95183.1 MAG: 30S ribosomal protein S11 [Microgenomates group bacterium RIFCSPLOWO2_01_FULL_46_13]